MTGCAAKLPRALLTIAALCVVAHGAVAADYASLVGKPTKGREAQSRSKVPVQAQPVPVIEAPPTGGTVKVDIGGAATRVLSLPRGKSAVIELPVDARDVLVSDPKVAEAVLSTPRKIFILGQGAGTTDAVFFDSAGRQLLRLDIRVSQDVAALADVVNRVIPGAAVKVEAVNDNIVLSGQVANAGDADKVVRLAQGYVAKPELVLNMLSIAGRDQVMLKVRIVEVNRSVIKQLGFNLNEVLGQVGANQWLAGITPTYSVNGSLLGGVTGGYQINTTTQPELQVPCGAGFPTGSLCPAVVHGPTSGYSNWNAATPQTTAGSTGVNKASAMIQAFERVGLVRTLAEPNLTAVSGESAKFLAGGEFPVPVSQDNNGRVTVEFKPFGVGLGFTPVVMSDGRISLKLSTEVSELSSVGAFTLASSNNSSLLSVPALTVRRDETTVEMPSGGAMMIGGLLQSTTKQTLDSAPGLMQLPVLGALFRSRDFQNNESELVVLVTAYIVKPVRPDQLATPADGLVIASDLDTNILGRLNKSLGKAPKAGETQTYQGPYGYVVD
jgi:pilus assembly protein CpaC